MSRCLFFLLFFGFQLGTLNAFGQYTKLLDFGDTNGGANPYGQVISDGTFLYGMTSAGGTFDQGIIYKIKPDGSAFTKLLDFNGTNGAAPTGSFYYDGVFLYGMTSQGGANDYGILFKIKPDGSGYASLLDFDNTTSGIGPSGTVISDGTFLYATAAGGGPGRSGNVFKIKPDGTGFTVLLNFDYTTNGGNPLGDLVTDGTFLYGTTENDGSSNYGTIYKVKTDGTGYAKIFNFNGSAAGSAPRNSLLYDGTFLYGTTLYGGANNVGVIFKIKPDGTAFTKLFDFTYLPTGAYSTAALVSDGTFLYGTTTQGGSKDGIVFKIKKDGTGFARLQDLDGLYEGQGPQGTLFFDGTSLYGTKPGASVDFSTLGYIGLLFKINTDGSGYDVMYTFEASGGQPGGSLVQIGGSFFGMTSAGGLVNKGTIFKVNSDGTGYTSLLDFTGPNGRAAANGRLIYDGTFLYGMTGGGGANDNGIIFKVKPDGTGFVDLLDFDVTNTGGYPNGSLIDDGVYLYGMANFGGTNSQGTIFKIKPDGSGFTKLLDFNDATTGSYPKGSLFSVASVLYGMTHDGGANGYGTMFRINPDGTGFAKLIDFDGVNSGSNPNASLWYDGTFFYGMTSAGGSSNDGTIFRIKPDGTGYLKLFDFNGSASGSAPEGSLFSDGTFLYGMTSYGGVLSNGTLFRIKPDGTGFLKFIDFSDGTSPQASLISDGTFLYGMTPTGGNYSWGTLFKSTLTPYVAVTTAVPASGVVGTKVTLYGTDFDPTPSNNVVKFNGVATPVTAATASTLTVQVPVGATTGPISVTASTTATSAFDFDVTTIATMSNDTIQNCNVPFSYTTNGDGDLTQTFLPVNPADKIKVSFTAFDVGDYLVVYDGASTDAPLLATLNGSVVPADIVATNPGGGLTFLYSWQDSGSDWDATITCVGASTLSIATQSLTVAMGGKVTLNLVPLITSSNNSLDTTSLEIVSPPASGAVASIDAKGVLTIDYSGLSFSGSDQITIKACDKGGTCNTQTFSIEVAGDLIVFNGISPTGVNPSFIIRNIDVLPDTKTNSVYIFDRWENQVWHGMNYDNNSVVFKGVSDGGSDLPTGVYYYKIDFASGRKRLTGFISLRRK